MSKNTLPLEKLAAILRSITDTALELHEQLEKSGASPLNDFERLVLSNSRRFSDAERASILWGMLLFTEPRLKSQKKFQTMLSTKLPNAEASLIVRQLMCCPPKAWSFRHSYQRGFGHTLAGPNAHTEVSIDACLSCWGDVHEADHMYGIGWTLTFEDQIFLVFTSELTQQQVYEIESIKPFPMQLNEDDFWEESIMDIIQNIYDPVPLVATSLHSDLELTDYSPELRFEKLSRIILNTVSSGVVRNSVSLQQTAAQGGASDILLAVKALFSGNVSTVKDMELQKLLEQRTLEAIGCDRDGNMPKAHISLLTSDPVGLLLLPDSLPMFKQLGPRDSIRLAFQFEDQNGTHDVADAFEIYQRERRWLAAFPCFDFTVEEHAARFGIPMDALQAVFAPALFRAHLPIVPQGDVLRQLQNKYGFYQPDAAPPAFIDVLNAMSSKTFQRTGNMASIVQWIISCCDRWRNCLCEIEPDNVQRTVSSSNQKLLQKGLKGLSDMFKKVPR